MLCLVGPRRTCAPLCSPRASRRLRGAAGAAAPSPCLAHRRVPARPSSALTPHPSLTRRRCIARSRARRCRDAGAGVDARASSAHGGAGGTGRQRRAHWSAAGLRAAAPGARCHRARRIRRRRSRCRRRRAPRAARADVRPGWRHAECARGAFFQRFPCRFARAAAAPPGPLGRPCCTRATPSHVVTLSYPRDATRRLGSAKAAASESQRP